MGTSHRHKPSVAGEPNWGYASNSVSAIARAEAELDDLEQELEAIENQNQEQEQDQEQEGNTPVEPHTIAAPPRRITKRQEQLGRQIYSNYHHAVRNLVRAAGGRSKVSSGSSKAVGHAGIAVARGIVSVFNEIVSNGLSAWLQKRGVGSLIGRRCKDVLDLIKSFINNDVAGLDNTAANEALESVMDEVGLKIGEDVGSFDNVMSAMMVSDDIKNLLDRFFGMYIFSHLSQNFQEKLQYERGSKVMNDTMEEIKELIMDDIARGIGGRDVSIIDWNTPEAEIFIQKEFDRIIYILTGNED